MTNQIDLTTIPPVMVTNQLKSITVMLINHINGPKVLKIDCLFESGGVDSRKEFLLTGKDYNDFYSAWRSGDDIIKFIFERFGFNLTIPSGEGESLFINPGV